MHGLGHIETLPVKTAAISFDMAIPSLPKREHIPPFLDPSLNLLSSIFAYFLTAQSTHCNCFLNADSILDTGSII
jgi:hypothetical protein